MYSFVKNIVVKNLFDTFYLKKRGWNKLLEQRCPGLFKGSPAGKCLQDGTHLYIFHTALLLPQYNASEVYQ